MRLSSLIDGADVSAGTYDDCDVKGLSLDSRSVKAGDLFAALAGSKADGGRFVHDALAKGACAVLTNYTTDVAEDASVPVIRAENPRRIFAQVCARFYGRQPDTVVAVTGTSGKTSVADFTRQIFEASGRRAASIGTIGVVRAEAAEYGALTTPDPVTLHARLAGLAADGVDYLAMEASSHGLDQYRLDGARLKAAAFTNLGRDHLDYHADMDAYLAAKLRLFTELLDGNGTAVINVDAAASLKVMEACTARGLKIIDVGRAAKTLRIDDVRCEGFEQTVAFTFNGRPYIVRLGLIGAYQVSNALVAAGLALAAGATPDEVVSALPKLAGVAGRLEIVGRNNDALAVVDYAHKPEALEAALSACRPFASNRLIVVFGCGGDRDRGKRAIMGRIADAAADVVIITDDNPRSEDAAAIRAEIRGGLQDSIEIGDRRQAIRHAIELAAPGDVVLVAGKGHETGQIVGDTVLPFSDQVELRAAMEAVQP